LDLVRFAPHAIQTGVGYPQLSAVIECSDAAHGVGGQIIADGGCVVAGDVAKAFGGGADFAMLGGMLAGHEQCDGELKEIDGQLYKVFYGMSSETAMHKYYGEVAGYRSSEGKTVSVKYRGDVYLYLYRRTHIERCFKMHNVYPRVATIQ
jgi:GMP reductase